LRTFVDLMSRHSASVIGDTVSVDDGAAAVCAARGVLTSGERSNSASPAHLRALRAGLAGAASDLVGRVDAAATRNYAAVAFTFGCTSAIASSEVLCTLIEQGGYTPIGALKITNRDIVTALGGLPDQKMHCSVMGAEALEAAVFNWAQKRGVDLSALGIDMHADEKEEGRLVCQCFGLTEPYLKRKIRELGLKTIAEITGAVKAGGACMTCHHKPGGLQDLLNDVWGAQPLTLKILPAMPEPRERVATDRPILSPYQFSKQVEKALDEYVRPMLSRKSVSPATSFCSDGIQRHKLP